LSSPFQDIDRRVVVAIEHNPAIRIVQLQIADCRLNCMHSYAIEQVRKAEQVAWNCTSPHAERAAGLVLAAFGTPVE
jgi:hypothetical protein